MTAHLPAVLALLASYAAGSIPSGLWFGLWLRGVDIREHGSRNIGATNTLRVLGKKLGGMTLAFDVLKGLLPVAAAGFVPSPLAPGLLPVLCGMAAILGHTFSLFLKFKGGKGVATSTGVFLALAPWQTLLAAAVFGLVVWRTRMVSAGSISAAAALLAAVLAGGADTPVTVVAVIIAVLVVYKHRANIGRILRGEENRF